MIGLNESLIQSRQNDIYFEDIRAIPKKATFDLEESWTKI